MQNIKKYFMTLALLLTAVTGAWAQDPTVNFPSEITVGKEFSFSFDAPDNVETVYLEIGNVFEIFSGISSNGGTLKYTYNGDLRGEKAVALYFIINSFQLQVVKSVTIKEPAPAEITEWPLTSQDGKTWTLAKMPGSDVELQVEYYPESNLFLGKEALKDKANISVLNGQTAVEFDAEGKSTATVTEGNTVTAKFTGKKVLGMKVVKKGGGEPVLLTTITAADNSSFKSGSQTFGDVATVTLTGDYLKNDGSHGGWYCQGSNKTATISVAEANGANITSVKFYTAGGGSAEDKDAPFEVTTTTVTSSNITTYLNGNSIGSYGVSKIEVYGTK